MEAYADRLDVDKIREAYEFAVETRFGKEGVTIVDGVTKLGKVQFRGRRPGESYRPEIRVAVSYGLKGKDLSAVEELIKQHESEIRTAWHKHFER